MDDRMRMVRQRCPEGRGGAEPAASGPALFRVVRFWVRGWAPHATGESSGEPRHAQAETVLEAVDAVANAVLEVSVNDIAPELGIDQSGASRFVTNVIDDGYLCRTASAADRRRAALAMTPAGRELLCSTPAWQKEVFAELTAHWPRGDVECSGHAPRRLAAELGDSHYT